MKWIEFAVYTTDTGVELVCGALASVGIEQVSIEESEERIEAHLRYAAPYWDFADAAALAAPKGPCVKAYIADLPEQQLLLAQAREAVRRILEVCPEADVAPLRVEETRMDEEDWANSWKRYYKPIPIGEKLLICPTWEEESLAPAQRTGRMLLRLDPGMVFGTGAHHTTRLCLEALEKGVQGGERVLDIGCGSGILSIAALLLGAAHATCVDIDPVADRVVRENMQINGLDDSRSAIAIGNALSDEALRARLQGQYDLVLANIVADVVIPLADLAPGWLRPGGLLLCSGVIDERGSEVEAALRKNGFTLLERRRSAEQEAPEMGWLAFLARREG